MTFDDGDCAANPAADGTTDTTAHITDTASTAGTGDTADATETETVLGARTSRGKRRRRALAAAAGALLVVLVPACQSASGQSASGKSRSDQPLSAGRSASADGKASAGQAARPRREVERGLCVVHVGRLGPPARHLSERAEGLPEALRRPRRRTLRRQHTGTSDDAPTARRSRRVAHPVWDPSPVPVRGQLPPVRVLSAAGTKLRCGRTHATGVRGCSAR